MLLKFIGLSVHEEEVVELNVQLLKIFIGAVCVFLVQARLKFLITNNHSRVTSGSTLTSSPST
jgi:hypothetical protein